MVRKARNEIEWWMSGMGKKGENKIRNEYQWRNRVLHLAGVN